MEVERGEKDGRSSITQLDIRAGRFVTFIYQGIKGRGLGETTQGGTKLQALESKEIQSVFINITEIQIKMASRRIQGRAKKEKKIQAHRLQPDKGKATGTF